MLPRLAEFGARSRPLHAILACLLASVIGDIARGQAACSWTKQRDTTADTTNATDRRVVAGLSECRTYCSKDPACLALLYKAPSCYTFHVLPGGVRKKKGWSYYTKECTEAPTPAPLLPPPLVSAVEKASCTWTELRDTAADETSAVDTVYVLSLFECWGRCDQNRKCAVTVFKSPLCRIFGKIVQPVDRAGWTYLRKSCQNNSDITSDSADEPNPQITSSTAATTKTSVVVGDLPVTSSCSWVEQSDTSLGDARAADSRYFLSRVECTEYCDTYPGCTAVVYRLLECRIYDDEITPVADEGWTLLRKSCTDSVARPTSGQESEPVTETAVPDAEATSGTETQTPIEPGPEKADWLDIGTTNEPETETSHPETETHNHNVSEPDAETATSSGEPAGLYPPASLANVTAPSCTWLELPDSSADEHDAVDTDYTFSQEECTKICADRTDCVVAVFNMPFCRIYDEIVPSVDDAGWTYLKKSCPLPADEASTTTATPGTAGTRSCTWSEVLDRSTKQVREVDSESASSLEECKRLCDQDSRCKAVVFNPPSCRKVYDLTSVDDAGWTYLKKNCDTTGLVFTTVSVTETTLSTQAELIPSTESEGPACSWTELPDTSAEESSAVDKYYFFSREECAELCASLKACVVAVFKRPFCRVYDQNIAPVDAAGWTYMNKSCTPTGPSEATDLETPSDPEAPVQGNFTEADHLQDNVTEEPSTSSGVSSSPATDTDDTDDTAPAMSCTWTTLPDMSADDSVLVETVYASSLDECQAGCQAASTCTVVIYSQTVCRMFHDVKPVADAGWTYMSKSCTPAETQAQPPEP